MRGTVAKRLRRGAEAATVGMPAAAYDFITQNKSYKDIAGNMRYFQMQRVRMVDKCTRKAYKLYKRFWMQAQRAGHHA